MPIHERRRTPRVPLPCNVKVETVRGTFNGRGRDLSDGGIGVYLHKLPPVGSQVTVSFQLPRQDASVEATGEVRYHSRGAPGTQDDWMGIKFLRMDQASQVSIHRYVKAHYDSSRPYAPAPPPLPKK